MKLIESVHYNIFLLMNQRKPEQKFQFAIPLIFRVRGPYLSFGTLQEDKI